MFNHPDIIELIETLNTHSVKFILIGGYAVIHYAEPRYTKDIDFLVGADANNAKQIVTALSEFGIPKDQIRQGLFEEEGNFFKFGQPPWRIDLITSVSGASFNEIYDRSQIQKVGEIELRIIAKTDLIKLKELAGRPQDLLDLEMLKK
ncbi:MAG: DUF6036 family nucleotidyltransferase [Bdellovibrionota bacterium]